MPKGYDPACEELARHFLADNPDELMVIELSQAIQDAVEGTLMDLPSTTPAPEPPKLATNEIDARLFALGFTRTPSGGVDIPCNGHYWMRGEDETIAMYRFRGTDHIEFARPVAGSPCTSIETDSAASTLLRMVEEYVAEYPSPVKAGSA